MVALLVLFMILGCLLADAILLSVRERRAVKAGELSTTPAHAMVFAQDGGKPVERKEKEITAASSRQSSDLTDAEKERKGKE